MAWTTPRTWTDGELVTASILNSDHRDNLSAIGNHYKIRKTADQSVTSSSTLVDDIHLTFPVAASEVWCFTITLQITSGAGGFRRSMAGPSGATGIWNEAYTITGDSKATAFTWVIGGLNSDVSARASTEYHQISGTIVNGVTAGFCRLQWAQGSSNPATTTLKANSYLLAHQIA